MSNSAFSGRMIAVAACLAALAGVAFGATNVTCWGKNGYGESSVPADLTNAVMVAGGYCHSLALRADGTVTAWGWNNNGQTSIPGGLTNVVTAAAGGDHCLAVRADGTVIAWGRGNNGQTNVPPDLSNVVAVAAGGEHSMALRSDGTIAVWGDNTAGQTNAPAGLTGVVAIAAGRNHSLALRADGTVAAWGEDALYMCEQTNVPAGLSGVVAAMVGGFHDIALRADGTVAAWGTNDFAQTNVPAGLGKVTAVAAGGYHCLALRADGTVTTWGRNSDGQTNTPSVLSNVVAVAAGGYHSLAVVGVGRPFVAPMVSQVRSALGSPVYVSVFAAGERPLKYAWRKDGVPLNGATNAFLAVNATNVNQSGNYCCVVSNAQGVTTGTIVNVAFVLPAIQAAPSAIVGYIGHGATMSVGASGEEPLFYQWLKGGAEIGAATSISYSLSPLEFGDSGNFSVVVSNQYGCVTSPAARLTVRQVAAWGKNDRGQADVPDGLTNAVMPGAGELQSYAVRGDGSLLAWGYNDFGQTNVPADLGSVIAAGGGWSHSAALSSDGTVRVWGTDGGYGVTNVPADLTNAVAISSGWSHIMALRADGTVTAWGYNANGATNVPAGLSDVVAVAAGNNHSVALRANGTVAAWGYNSVGQADAPADLTNAIAVSAWGFHSLALRADGTVVMWGQNGAASVPAGLSNVTAVAAGVSFDMALRADGTVTVWGTNQDGQKNVPAGLSNVVAIAASSGHCLAEIGLGAPVVAPMADRLKAALDAPVFLLARATGARPLTYSWQRNGAPLDGATRDLLTITATNANQSGDYSCVVSNALGVTTGTPVHVEFVSPVIDVSPTNSVVFIGQSWTASVNASGEAPLGYQWFKNGAAIGGATSSSYTVSPAAPGDAGTYTAVVSNRYGSRTSSAAQFEVRNVRAWGFDDCGQVTLPAGLSNVVAVAGGGSHSLALHADGTVAAWGRSSEGQTTVPAGLSNVVAISAGGAHSFALSSDGRPSAWGSNDFGQATVPLRLTNVVAVSAGGFHNMALCSDGRPAAWGSNDWGQADVPLGLSNVVAVSAGGSFNTALGVDGAVHAWGDNTYGQIDVPADLSNVVAVSAGYYHALALRADGIVVPWGRNDWGQTNVPPGLDNVVAVSAGEGHSLALRADGTVVAWGRDDSGQASVPAGLSNVTAISAGFYHSLAAVGVGRPFLPPMVRQVNAFPTAPFFLLARPGGARPLFCRWQKNGAWLAGATNALLTMNMTSTTQSGLYRCVVSNELGVTTGSEVQVTYIPYVVAPVAPTGMVDTTRTPVFAWVPQPGATWHKLLIYKDGAIYKQQWVQGATNWTPVTALVPGKYQWWVRDWNESAGYVTPWSAAMGFYIPAHIPGTITALTPAGSENTTNRPAFTWSSDPRGYAESYKLQINKGDVLYLRKWVSDGSVTNYMVTSNMPYGKYTWWVRAWHPDGYGPWSAPVTFSLGVPTPVAPTGTIAGTREPGFAWTPAVNATRYALKINRNGTTILQPSVVGATNWIPADGLRGGNYQWWVRAWNAQVGYGPWSSSCSFAIPYAVPARVVTVSPTGTVTATSVGYIWQATGAATWYQMWIRRDGTTWQTPWYETGFRAGLLTTTIPGHVAGSTYKWCIRGWSPDGYGPWSVTNTFTVVP